MALATVAVIGAAGAMSGIAVESHATKDMTIVAEFEDASPVLVGNEVKVDGVAVGEVADTRVADGHADVLLSLEPSALPVYRDATVRLRPVSLLGERYIDLDRGTPGSEQLADGDTVPLPQTSVNVDLDEILNTVDDPTGESLAFLVTTLGEGLRDNGGNVDAALTALAPALRDTQSLTSVLKDQNVLLGNMVDNVQPVAGALAADDGKSLDTLVASADRLLAASAAQQEQFDKTLEQLPGALRSARSALGELAGTANEATPTLRAVRPVTEDLSTISDELNTFADSLDPALANAQPVLEKAQKLLDEAAPVASDLKGASPDLREASASARPIADNLTGNLDNVLDFIRYWALTTNGHDGLSHYFRVNLLVNPDSVTGLAPADLPVPDLLPGPAPVNGEPPGAGPAPQPEPEPGGTLLQPPTTEPQPAGPEATGLTPEQEHGMVDYLLGGGR
ncbi:MlaD family protein [Pseudonocardia ammonioxydans]|uniref:MlaD family protein n=1 Tax=Pseudonocardia ammonioxydans TaxID=260086 RepID=UPI001FEA921A|nr:MlaD family protein [Pseudonocardia ammonioxydans]